MRACATGDRWVRVGWVCAMAATLSGCAVFGAGGGGEVFPLEVPVAPPRIVAEFPADIPAPDEPEPVVEEVFEEEPAVGADVDVGVVSEPVAAPVPSRVAEPEPDVVPDVTPEPLQLAPDRLENVDAEVVHRGLRGTARILEGIDRTTLNAASRAQHDTARRFLNQATAALAAGNLTFAHYLNEKAETLARDLEAR